MGSSRRFRVAAFRVMSWTVVLVTLVAASGCTRLIQGRVTIGLPRVGAPVEWRECEVRDADGSHILPGAQCGKIAVPVDYANPRGDRAAMALIKFPATGTKIGSLVLNPGGPGESGMQAAANMAPGMPPEIRERFDVVGFDPRGVAGAMPAVWCNSDADNDRLRAEPLVDYSPAGVARIEQLNQEFVQRCVDKNGKEFLENVGTRNVAQDLDVLRAGLGDDKLTYLGYSYGTRIGSAYAEAFPQNVRAMVLDGAIDPNMDPIEADVRQAAAFEKAFDDYAADCAKSAACPLGTDPAKSVDVYLSMVDPLVKKPARTTDPRGLSYNDAITGTIMPLYSPTFWQHLTTGLAELKSGHGDTLLKLSDIYMHRNSHGHYDNSTDVRVAVNCVDQPAVLDRRRVIEEDRRIREVAPFMSYGKFTGDAPLGVCAFWPVPPTSFPHTISVEGLPPTLVVSTTGDPATPYQAGVDLAKQLGGGLLTFDGTQHTVVFQGNDCVDRVATRYFVDVALPPAGTRCAAT